MKTKNYYISLFENYPDVVTIVEFKSMLGGIADTTARKLIREGHVKHFYIRDTYLIPKSCVIDYVLSKHYSQYKQKLKVQI